MTKFYEELKELAEKDKLDRNSFGVADFIRTNLPAILSALKNQGLLRELLEAKTCENCPNQGWYADRDRATGDPVQVQCEFCYCEPTSVFNVKQRVEAALTDAAQSQEDRHE